MEITHYFLHFSYATKAKNKLYEEFESFLKALNGKLIPTFEINQLKKLIEEKVKELNASYYRCNPIKIHFTSFESDNDISIHGTHVTFYIHPASSSKVENLKR